MQSARKALRNKEVHRHMPQAVRRKPQWARILGAGFYGFVCFFVLIAAALAGWINTSPVVKTVLMRSITHQTPEEAWGGKDSVTLLILGCDEDRYYGGQQIIRHQARSDMILITKLDFKNNRITGISIPRDTLAAPAGYRREKINAFHLIGGANLSKTAVESLVPVSIDKVVVLNFDAFKEMVDLVGGVQVDVPKKMDYDDNRGDLHIHLKPGPQILDGDKAEQFVRFRHTDDDFHRQARQKDFLLAFKAAVIHRPGMLMQVAEKARDVMGDALTPEEVASLALFVRSVGPNDIKMGMVPTVSAGNYNLRVDSRKLPSVLRQFNMTPGGFQSEVSSLP